LTAGEAMARATAPERLTHLFYFQLGAAYERNKEHAEAVKYFEKCLEMEPDFAEALNYLGYMWAERGENLERAKILIEKALKQEPENAAFLDSMAWVLFKLNQPKPALDWMLKAMKHIEEEDATLYDHLGDIYASMKDYPKAREAWEKSLKIEVSDEVKKKLESAPKQ
ncbi:MAG: tetratricopeptide repeat protein, partial [Verrucomicrobiota bacterium]